MGHLLTVVKMRLLNQEIRNTFWWGGDDAVHDNAQEIIDEIADAYRDELAPSGLVEEWSLYAFDVYDKTVEGAPGIEYIPDGAAIVGSDVTDPAATQLSVRVDFKASVPKPNTNRKFLGGWKEGIMGSGGLIDPLVVASCEDWGDRILALPAVTVLAVVLEVVHLSDVDGTVVASNPLTYRRVSVIPSTLRRRKIGVGV